MRVNRPGWSTRLAVVSSEALADVQPELRLIRRGKLRLVPIRELERWADSAAERTLRSMRRRTDTLSESGPATLQRPGPWPTTT